MNILQYDEGIALYTRNLIESDAKLTNLLDTLVKKFIVENDDSLTTKNKRRRFAAQVENYEIDVALKIAIFHITKILRRFARWFSYMWNKPTLNQKTFKRLSRKYPYKTTHFLRQRKILLPPRAPRRIFQNRNLDNKKLKI
jgi:hypothetical protein